MHFFFCFRFVFVRASVCSCRRCWFILQVENVKLSKSKLNVQFTRMFYKPIVYQKTYMKYIIYILIVLNAPRCLPSVLLYILFAMKWCQKMKEWYFRCNLWQKMCKISFCYLLQLRIENIYAHTHTRVKHTKECDTYHATAIRYQKAKL